MPHWFTPYGTTPDAFRCLNGWVLMQLGSIGDDKASFYVRVFEWTYPEWQVIEVPMEQHFIHAQFADIEDMLFLFGLCEYGDCFEQVPGFQPYQSSRTLSHFEMPITEKEDTTSQRYLQEHNRLWRSHQLSL